jgi:transposase
LKKYVVNLTPTERANLEALTRKGTVRARQIKRALILLAVDEGEKDELVAAKVRVHPNTVARIRHRFAEEGLEKALSERARPGNPRRLDGRQEAYLIALACSDPPEGRDKWTMRLLAGRLVELDVIDGISHQTIMRTLKRGTSSPGNAESGASPQ